MSTKLTGRTPAQSDAVKALGLAGFSTTPSTITFDGSPAEGEKAIELALTGESDRGKRVALHAVRRAFAKLAGTDTDEQPEGEPVGTSPAEVTDAEVDRLARVDQAKAEAAELKAWKSNGSKGDKPATPALDALEAEANNRKPNGAKKSSRRSSKSSTPKVEQPAPKAERGQSVIALRNDKHGDVVTAALKASKVSPEVAKVDGRFLTLRNADAQVVFEAITEASSGQGQFTTRLLTLAGLGVRHACPKVTDSRSSLVARLVTALHDSGKTWTVGAATDATPTFTIDGTEYATAKEAAAAIGVSAKAAA